MDKATGRRGEGARTATAALTPGPSPTRGEGRGENGAVADEIWAALKATRKAPRWHRTVWAAEFGFSSYTRFFRACLLCCGKTPHQLELELIDEILLEAEENGDSNGRHEEHGEERKEHEKGQEGEAETVKRE